MNTGRVYPGLENAEIRRLLAVEENLAEVALRFGLEVKRTPPAGWIQATSLAPSMRKRVSQSLRDLTHDLLVCERDGLDPWNDGLFLTVSMRRMGLTYPMDWLDHIVEGDLVEGYDMNRFQVFRNLQFMQKSSYSLVELMSYEWPVLFDRSSIITQRLMTYCDEILWLQNKTIVFDVPVHFIRELRSVDRQVLEVQFKYLSPLFSGPGRPYGILASCRAIPVKHDDPVDKVRFV